MTRLSYKWKPGGSQARGLRAKFLRANSPRGSREHRSSFPAKTPPPSNRHSLPQNFASMRGVQSNAFSWRHSDDQPYHERTSPAENARQGGSNEPLPLISPSAPLPTQSPIHRRGGEAFSLESGSLASCIMSSPEAALSSSQSCPLPLYPPSMTRPASQWPRCSTTPAWNHRSGFRLLLLCKSVP